MRIFLVEQGENVGQGALPFEASAPTAIPETLRASLQDAPTLNGAAFKATDLAKALGTWAIVRDDPREWISEEDSLEVSLLPMVLMLGRDLMLVGRGDIMVSVQ